MDKKTTLNAAWIGVFGTLAAALLTIYLKPNISNSENQSKKKQEITVADDNNYSQNNNDIPTNDLEIFKDFDKDFCGAFNQILNSAENDFSPFTAEWISSDNICDVYRGKVISKIFIAVKESNKYVSAFRIFPKNKAETDDYETISKKIERCLDLSSYTKTQDGLHIWYKNEKLSITIRVYKILNRQTEIGIFKQRKKLY